MTSPAAAVAAACHGVRAAMPLDLMPFGRNSIVFGTAADSPRLPHARFLPPPIFQQQNARGSYAARLCLTKQTPGRVHTAVGRAAYRGMCRHVSLVSYPTRDLGKRLRLKPIKENITTRNETSKWPYFDICGPLRRTSTPICRREELLTAVGC